MIRSLSYSWGLYPNAQAKVAHTFDVMSTRTSGAPPAFST